MPKFIADANVNCPGAVVVGAVTGKFVEHEVVAPNIEFPSFGRPLRSDVVFEVPKPVDAVPKTVEEIP